MANKLSYHEKVELAEEAKRLLSPNSMFNKIVNGLIVECHEKLIQAEVGSLTASAAHASMKALNDIKIRLQIFVNDVTMEKDRNDNG